MDTIKAVANKHYLHGNLYDVEDGRLIKLNPISVIFLLVIGAPFERVVTHFGVLLAEGLHRP